MIRKRTVFILGAGASRTFGFPLGADLRDEVRLQFDRLPGNASESGHPNNRSYLLFKLTHGKEDAQRTNVLQTANAIYNGIPFMESVDDFMTVHRENRKVARMTRLAITLSILRHEHTSLNTQIEPSVNDRWPFRLWHIMRNGVDEKTANGMFDESVNAVRFITFNYDRSLESFLFKAHSRAFFRTNPRATAEALTPLRIMHVYGSLGPLQWQTQEGAFSHGYGDLEDLFEPLPSGESKIDTIAGGIRVYSERTESDAHLAEIHETMKWAEQIVFLGFGFNRHSINLIFPKNELITASPIVATRKGLRERPKRHIHGILCDKHKARTNANVDLYDETCEGILEEYDQTLRWESSIRELSLELSQMKAGYEAGSQG